MRKLIPLLLVITACSATAVTTTVPPTTTTERTTTTRAATTTSTPTTSCDEYRAGITGPMLAALDAMTEGEAIANSAEESNLPDIADAFFIQADRLFRAAEDIRTLGEPPEEWAEGIPTMLRGVDRMIESFELASRGAREGDLSKLEGAASGITEGALLFQEASAQLEPC